MAPKNEFARARANDRGPDAADAVRHAFDTYSVSIYQFAYRRLGNRDDAEDVTAQVFYKAARALDPAFSEPEQRAWLYRAARSAIADIWRSYGGMSIVSLEWYVEAPPPLLRENAVADRRVELILAELPLMQRRVLELRFLGGRTSRETADELGLTETNVKVIQHRALRRAAELEAGHPDD